ncbi:hypothetical protein PG993_002349 [Apiospora rasikravindrae]|uniref:Ecp2 effector protein-like domain-containing protein n=1 Tax=Apiospora rasikravindrae TaxID=990691 RepID=A0ABR1TWE4_9PEZI
MFFMLPVLAFAGLGIANPVSLSRDPIASGACATAAPIPGMTTRLLPPPKPKPPPVSSAPSRASTPGTRASPPITECGTSLVQDGRPDDTSPDATDCAAVAAFAQSHAGFWTLTPDNLRADPWTVVMVYQTCALVMSTLDGAAPRWPIYVGDQDVATAVQSACDKYATQGNKLDATAVLGCNTSNGRGGEDKVQTKLWLRNSVGVITK